MENTTTIRELTISEMDLCAGGFSFKEFSREAGRQAARDLKIKYYIVRSLFD